MGFISAGWSSSEACQGHSLKVEGSNPSPAIFKIEQGIKGGGHLATKETKIKPKALTKMTAAEARQRVVDLEEELENEKELIWCYMCNKKKKPDRFYVSTDPLVVSGLVPICKDCARAIALRRDKNNKDHEPTKESVTKAMMYLNKPMLDAVWDSSIAEATNENNAIQKNNPYTAYIKNIAMINYYGLTFKDSDMFKTKVIYEDEKTPETLLEEHEGQDTYTDFLKNKADVTRLLSYDPFEKEAISDQPFLYSQLLGLLDASEDANDDMMRTASCISIVRNFLQLSKIDDTIAKLMSDITQLQNNSATIKSLQESKKGLTSTITSLAKESCISLLNSKNSKKGENTWTGKIKKIRDLNLRAANVNGFDIQTCRGMQQVQEISDASIMKQLALDESEWSDMVAEMRETIVALRKEKDQYKEINRILLQENLDLKDFIEENSNINILPHTVNLKEIYAPFSSLDEEESEEVLDNADSE